MHNIQAAKQIASLMLEIRQLSKEISTYYESTIELTYPDQMVHAQFNHTATATGRLSCKAPNIQNSPASSQTRVPEHFISRFDDGVLISADYKGIEPRIEAQLSGDVMKISDIINGVDDHTKNLALKENITYEDCAFKVESDDAWQKMRKQIKGFTFAVQYDASAKPRSIAYNSGLNIDLVTKLLEARKRAYPRLHLYYSWLQSEVTKSGQYSDPWGRIYKFKKYPPKKGEAYENYSANQIQNYRSQGYATGTIVLAMIGRFWREKALYNRAKYLMVNTIHDSLILDCRKEYEDARKDLTILTDVCSMSKKYFDYNFIVPIEIEISAGNRWSDL